MTNTTDKLIQPFGYTEMYEWVKVPITQKYAKFVQFSKRYPERIELFHDNNAVLAGVSSICSVMESDDPAQWKYAYMCNSAGDVFVREETLTVGIKCYDQHNELSYISTRPWKHYVKVPNKHLDKSLKYVPRSSRNEWVRVTLLGKAIVEDDGTVKPGEYCMPFCDGTMEMAGTATKWDGKSPHKFYVLERMTDNSIVIVVNTF